MNKNTRSRISLVLACCLALTLAVGSFAFFTDRHTSSANATAGTIDLVFTDVSAQAYKTADQDNTQDQSWNNGLATDIINPGDNFDLAYELTNTGSKSIDVRQRIVLTSDVAMTADAEEYKLTITGGENDTAVVPTKPDAYTLVYDLADIILAGSQEPEDDATASGEYAVKLAFAKEAKNAFMGSKVTINLYATAKQHRNTVEGDFPAFDALASVTNATGDLTVGEKVVEKIG